MSKDNDDGAPLSAADQVGIELDAVDDEHGEPYEVQVPYKPFGFTYGSDDKANVITDAHEDTGISVPSVVLQVIDQICATAGCCRHAVADPLGGGGVEVNETKVTAATFKEVTAASMPIYTNDGA